MLKMIELPYPINALEPYYSKETLDLHYNILYKGYVDNINETQEKLKKARKTYHTKRPDYINAFWNIVNWNEVNKRFDLIK